MSIIPNAFRKDNLWGTPPFLTFIVTAFKHDPLASIVSNKFEPVRIQIARETIHYIEKQQQSENVYPFHSLMVAESNV